MVILQKNLPDGFIGTVPVTQGIDGPQIGTGILEKVGARIVVHIDAADIPDAIMSTGFRLGSISLCEDPFATEEPQ